MKRSQIFKAIFFLFLASPGQAQNVGNIQKQLSDQLAAAQSALNDQQKCDTKDQTCISLQSIAAAQRLFKNGDLKKDKSGNFIVRPSLMKTMEQMGLLDKNAPDIGLPQELGSIGKMPVVGNPNAPAPSSECSGVIAPKPK